MEQIELQVAGMTCGSCVARVNRALLSVPGVQGAEVDLASGLAHVSVSDAERALNSLLRALTDAGYPAQISTASTSTATGGAAAKRGCGSRQRVDAGCCCRH